MATPQINLAQRQKAKRWEQGLVSEGLTLLAWIGCFFPWTLTTGAAFTNNLFDLAEWSSLDSTVRYGSNPPLLPPFFLRLAVGLIALALTIQAEQLKNRPARWALRILALLIGIGLLPPIAFFTGSFGDPNYRQQAVIGGLTSLGVVLISVFSARLPERTIRIAGVIACLLALISGLLGEALANNALSAFQLHLAVGGGAVVFALGLLGAMVIGLRRQKSKTSP